MDSFWSRWKNQLIWKVFIPYCIYSLLALSYYASYLISKERDETEIFKEFCLALAIVILGTYFFYFEIRIICTKPLSQVVSPQNFFDLSSYLLIVLILARRYLFEKMWSDSTQFWLASISGFLIQQKLLYFGKLSNTAGFYVRLLSETFLDMLPFTFLLYLVIIVFATSFYILNRVRLEIEEVEDTIYPLVVEGISDYWLGGKNQ